MPTNERQRFAEGNTGGKLLQTVMLYFKMYHTVYMKPKVITGHYLLQGGENHQKGIVNICQQMRC